VFLDVFITNIVHDSLTQNRFKRPASRFYGLPCAPRCLTPENAVLPCECAPVGVFTLCICAGFAIRIGLNLFHCKQIAELPYRRAGQSTRRMRRYGQFVRTGEPAYCLGASPAHHSQTVDRGLACTVSGLHRSD
jgi:hypothetical protein